MKEDIVMVSECPVCNGKELSFFTYGGVNPDLHKLLGTPERMSEWSHCRSCNHVFLNPRFNNKIENRLYGEESLYRKYSIGKGSVDEYLKTIDNTIGNKSAIHGTHHKLLKKIIQATKLGKGAKVLDFGAGFGPAESAFLAEKMDYQGYEFDDYCLNVAKENNRNVLKKVKKEPVYDLVYSSQVFEHISLPYQAALDAVDFAKNNGFIFINVPTHQYQIIPPKSWGPDGYNCMVWTHYHSYTIESLAYLFMQSGKVSLFKAWNEKGDLNMIFQKKQEMAEVNKIRKNYSTDYEKIRLNLNKIIFGSFWSLFMLIKKIAKFILGRQT